MKQPTIKKGYVTERQAAEILGRGMNWFQNDRYDGAKGKPLKLQYIKVGNRILYKKDDVLDYRMLHPKRNQIKPVAVKAAPTKTPKMGFDPEWLKPRPTDPIDKIQYGKTYIKEDMDNVAEDAREEVMRSLDDAILQARFHNIEKQLEAMKDKDARFRDNVDYNLTRVRHELDDMGVELKTCKSYLEFMIMAYKEHRGRKWLARLFS